MRGSFAADMSVIVILVSASFLIAVGFLVAFLWAVKSGQYDDDYAPSVRILFDSQNDKKEHLKTDNHQNNP
jgi:cbb3-type cytochrome oxidase maturation protein